MPQIPEELLRIEEINNGYFGKPKTNDRSDLVLFTAKLIYNYSNSYKDTKR